MGMTLRNAYSYIYLLYMVILISSIVFAAGTTVLEDVCPQTHDQPLCMNVLGSDPRSPDASLHMLGEIAIDLGFYSATGTKVKIHSLLLSEKDPDVKVRLTMCDACYENAIASLTYAVDNLNHLEYTTLNLDGASAYMDGYDCEETFKEPPAYRSPLTDENKRIELFGEVITIIANMLA
ncbi:hypothetical protein OROGR_029374 [Orobanche gracilis]